MAATGVQTVRLKTIETIGRLLAETRMIAAPSAINPARTLLLAVTALFAITALPDASTGTTLVRDNSANNAATIATGRVTIFAVLETTVRRDLNSAVDSIAGRTGIKTAAIKNAGFGKI